MPAQSIFGLCWKRFSVYVTAVAAFSLLLVANASANTTRTILMDVSGGNEKPSYSVSPLPSGVSDCSGTNSIPPPSAEYLYICPGDTVEWKLKTRGKKGRMTVFQKDAFLTRPGDSTTSQWFHASEGSSDSGTSDVNAGPGEHEYCVAVFDNNGSLTHLYAHDPKIIIGGTLLEVLIKDLQADCAKLPAAIDHDVVVNGDKKKLLREQTAKACEQVETLRNLLPPRPPR